MEKAEVFNFIAKQKTAFLASVNEQGYPVVRAMLAPRKIEGNELYFSTNTSSKKIRQYTENNKACVYFYKRGLFRYQGVGIFGEMEICTDQSTKESVWRPGDKLFYRQGVTDPDYCVLKFKCEKAEYYCDLKTGTIVF
ncbi:MAG: pyridoxamine 5'-phosphate oxidase family protein [Clostridia bacterium]|nr:pyridoxamine 5'-phosphate oxidase family protein [Clostridia bacterium]